MDVGNNLKKTKSTFSGYNSQLIAVSKTYPPDFVMEAYETGHRAFGENKVQELVHKHEVLPKDIEWHFIGHLQTNKVKYIAPFIHLIHSVDSMKLLKEINKEGKKNNRVINCLLQMYIAKEETKFGLSGEEVKDILESPQFKEMNNIKILGVMGMATNTENKTVVAEEFKTLKYAFDEFKESYSASNIDFKEISMGMSSDYNIALKEGSTMVRIGSAIFGARQY